MTQPAANLLDPQAAYDVIYGRVHAPVFFEKLANDFGIRPQDQQEADTMLKMASRLRNADDQYKKQASANSSLSAAAAHLDKQLGQMGLGKQSSASDYTQQAAAHASFNPELANAFLSLHVASQQADN